MPALQKSSVGSFNGTTGLEGTLVCAFFFSKKSIKASRTLSAGQVISSCAVAVAPWASLAALQLERLLPLPADASTLPGEALQGLRRARAKRGKASRAKAPQSHQLPAGPRPLGADARPEAWPAVAALGLDSQRLGWRGCPAQRPERRLATPRRALRPNCASMRGALFEGATEF
mmetsp:Transcript_14957/g.26579  ORF Transcript_14957/g.26579 Transcript_14957/m.26579 type:complete len:174 (+) Transcript_14957:1855-2376(+)